MPESHSPPTAVLFLRSPLCSSSHRCSDINSNVNPRLERLALRKPHLGPGMQIPLSLTGTRAFHITRNSIRQMSIQTPSKRVFPPLYQSSGSVSQDRLAFFHILERLKVSERNIRDNMSLSAAQTQKRTGWVDHNVSCACIRYETWIAHRKVLVGPWTGKVDSIRLLI